jgi:carbon storage regulator
MLVLTRKVDERINIGNDVAVIITRIAGNRVTVGIEAPQHVSVTRGELDGEVEKKEESAA